MAGDVAARVRRGVERWRRSPALAVARALPGVDRRLTAWVTALTVLGPALGVAFIVAAGQLIGAVPGAVAGGFDSAAGRRLLVALTVAGALFVAQSACAGARDALAGALGRRLDAQLRRRVMAATLGAPGVAHLEDPSLLDKVSLARAVGPNRQTPGLAAGGLFQVAGRRLAVVGAVVIVGSFRWWLPLVVGGSYVLLRHTMHRYLMKVVEVAVGQTSALRRSSYFSDLALLPGAAKETRVFGLAGWVGERFTGHWLAAMREVWKERARHRRSMVLPFVLAVGAALLGYVAVARAGARGDIDLARLSIVLGGLSGLRGLLSVGNEDLHVAYGAGALPAVAALEEAVAQPGLALPGGRPTAGLPRRSVRFEGVCFRYPGGGHDVYDGLDLELRAGESLAVVGVNGAGKTTLVKLLARLYDPTAGRITVDGVDLRDLDARAWQRRVAAIFQDFTRYELPARDNVGFGALPLRDDDAALRHAADQAGILDVVEQLGHGWDTVLSRQFRDGTDLSGGQWQRVALARALLAVQAGAGILVLDEPTANLDVRAEAELYERFLELTRDVTTVVISHRFSTVRRADRIVVLDGGRVVEEGTHDELVAAGGRYARMFSLQAARYADSSPAEGVISA